MCRYNVTSLKCDVVDLILGANGALQEGTTEVYIRKITSDSGKSCLIELKKYCCTEKVICFACFTDCFAHYAFSLTSPQTTPFCQQVGGSTVEIRTVEQWQELRRLIQRSNPDSKYTSMHISPRQVLRNLRLGLKLLY